MTKLLFSKNLNKTVKYIYIKTLIINILNICSPFYLLIFFIFSIKEVYMKKKLMPYLLSYAFLIVSYLVISFIMTILFSFIHVSSFVYQLVITFFSYLTLVIFTFFFYKLIKEKPLIHGFILSMTYCLIQLLFHLKDIHFSLFIKPLCLLIIYYLLYYINKKQQ